MWEHREYVGPDWFVRDGMHPLRGYTALLREGDGLEPGKVFAQFDDVDRLPRRLTHGWTAFPAYAFGLVDARSWAGEPPHRGVYTVAFAGKLRGLPDFGLSFWLHDDRRPFRTSPGVGFWLGWRVDGAYGLRLFFGTGRVDLFLPRDRCVVRYWRLEPE